MKLKLFFLCFLLVSISFPVKAQKKAILAYYSGSIEGLDNVDPNQFTHIIYCFGHLNGNRLHIGRARDSAKIQKMVAMKEKNKDLKVLLSLGGWGGCKPCSDVFNTEEGRKEFARSVKELTDYFKSDGIDLDWEYPAIPGHPGHPYRTEDRDNFTALCKELRKALGKKALVTFAAGGFQKFVDSAIDWKNTMKYVDYVNLMTYDLVGGYATVTGHHTGLYSTSFKKESTDNCVQSLIRKGVDRKKLIVGGAFYARVWENVEPTNNGLFQAGKFRTMIGYNSFEKHLSPEKGFAYYWDSTAQAPYAYNAAEKLYATFDDKRSIELKSQYVLKHKLGGIMFWELSLDKPKDGLLQTINNVLRP